MVWDGSLEITKTFFGGFFAMKEIIRKTWCTLGLCPQTESLKYSWLGELNLSSGWEPQLQGASQALRVPSAAKEGKWVSRAEHPWRGRAKAPGPAQQGWWSLHTLGSWPVMCSTPWDWRQGPGIRPKSLCVGRVKTTWAVKPLQLSHKPELLDKLSKIVLSAQQAHDSLHKGVLLEISWIPPLSQGLSTEPHISRPLPPVISFFTVIMEYFDGDDCLKASTSLLMWLEDLTPFHSLVAPAITLIYFRQRGQ